MLDAFNAGANLVDIYELYDESAIYGSDTPESYYGIFDANANPKGAATNLHNMLSVIGDAGSNASSFSTGSLNYSVTGLSSPGQSVLLQKSNGAYEIIVWTDVTIYAYGNQSTPPTQNVTVNLGGTHVTVNSYDPTVGTSPTQTLSNVSSVSLSLTDHAMIIEVIR